MGVHECCLDPGEENYTGNIPFFLSVVCKGHTFLQHGSFAPLLKTWLLQSGPGFDKCALVRTLVSAFSL